MTSSDVGEFFSSAGGNAAEPPPPTDGRRRPVRAGVRHVGGCRCDEDDALGIAAVDAIIDADVVGESTDDDEEDCERNDKRRMACGGIGGDDQRLGILVTQRPNIPLYEKEEVVVRVGLRLVRNYWSVRAHNDD